MALADNSRKPVVAKTARLGAVRRVHEAGLAGSAEEEADARLFPIARRHSLARKDRDHMKRVLLALRRFLTGELHNRTKSRLNKFLARDYAREALVLLWVHARAVGLDMETVRTWQNLAREIPAQHESSSDRRPRNRGGRNRSRGGNRNSNSGGGRGSGRSSGDGGGGSKRRSKRRKRKRGS